MSKLHDDITVVHRSILITIETWSIIHFHKIIIFYSKYNTICLQTYNILNTILSFVAYDKTRVVYASHILNHTIRPVHIDINRDSYETGNREFQRVISLNFLPLL